MARIKLKIQRPWIPYIIFVITLSLTLLATFYISNQTYTEDRLRFLNVVLDTNTTIRTQVETYIALLRGTAGLFAAIPDLNKDQFSRYVTSLKLDKNYVGAMGLGYVEKIEGSDKDTFIQSVQQEDNETFTIMPVGDRKEYYVVRYLNRTDKKSPTSVGKDLATVPLLKKAMDNARDNGLSAGSEIEEVLDKPTNKNIKIFVIFTPVYKGGGIPPTITERRSALEGFIYMPFNINLLLSSIFGNRVLPEQINYKIYDNADLTKQYLLYDSNMLYNKNSSLYLPRFMDTRQFVVGGNIWTIQYTNNPQFDLESAKDLSTIIFIGGILVCVMFFTLSRSQYIARTKAEIAASELELSKRELQKAVSHRDNFISIASHELKTPVTSLKVYAQLLLRQSSQKEDKKTVDYLTKINRQIDKLTSLIQDLLNVSRIQKNQLTFRMEQCDLNEIVKEIIDNTQQITDHHKIILEGKIKKKIYCDKERISQVLINLLTNAIKYSPLSDKIIVQLSETKNDAIISVTDFGIGISKEYQRKVFDRFYRISGTSGETYPGLGIGLYISHAIVKRHGGEFKILSEKGKGSTFRFNLPNTKK
jgi:signal transduction histidine kinase